MRDRKIDAEEQNCEIHESAERFWRQSQIVWQREKLWKSPDAIDHWRELRAEKFRAMEDLSAQEDSRFAAVCALADSQCGLDLQWFLCDLG